MCITRWRGTLLKVTNQLAPIITMCTALALIVFLMEQTMPRFVVDDLNLNFPVVKQTLTTEAAAGLMFIYPFLALVIHTALKARYWGRGVCDRKVIIYWWDKTWCAMFVCFIFILFSEFLKRWVGRLRPNFFAMCLPKYSETVVSGIAGIVTNYSCESDETCESCRSFPSGHSLFAILLFSAMGNLFEAHRGKDKVMDPTWATRLMMQAVLTFVVGPALAITRYTEHYHHASDVLVGIVGGYIAFVILLFMEHCFVKEPTSVLIRPKEGQEFTDINSGRETTDS